MHAAFGGAAILHSRRRRNNRKRTGDGSEINIRYFLLQTRGFGYKISLLSPASGNRNIKWGGREETKYERERLQVIFAIFHGNFCVPVPSFFFLFPR